MFKKPFVLVSRKRSASIGAATILLAIILAACGQTDTGRVDMPDASPSLADGLSQAPVSTKPLGKTRVLTQFAGGTLTHLSAKGTLTFERPMILPIRSAGISALKVDDVTELKPGDVLMSAPTDTAPYGFIRKIEKLEGSNSEVIVSTSQATLEDAIKGSDLPAGSYKITEAIPTDKVIAESIIGQNGKLVTQGVQTFGNERTEAGFYSLPLPQKGIKSQGSTQLGSQTQCVNLPLTSNTGDFGSTVCFRMSANAILDLQLGIAWAWFIPYPTVDRFLAKIVGDARGSLDIKAGYTGQFFKPIRTQLAGFTYAPMTFWIGPLPVVVVPQYDISISANGSLTANANFSIAASAYAEIGAQYVRDAGWTPIQNLTGSFEPQVSAGSRIGVDFSTSFDNTASLMFYGTAGPAFSFSPYATASYDFFNQKGRVVAGTRGAIGINATGLFSFLSFSYPIFSNEWKIAEF